MMLTQINYFNLRVVVLWTINDYPELGALCGSQIVDTELVNYVGQKHIVLD